MATKKSRQNTASSRIVAVPKPPSNEKPVALTLKVDSQTYVRLCTLGATERRTNQDILQKALKEYLDRFGA
jgi:hypothetical protein